MATNAQATAPTTTVAPTKATIKCEKLSDACDLLITFLHSSSFTLSGDGKVTGLASLAVDCGGGKDAAESHNNNAVPPQFTRG